MIGAPERDPRSRNKIRLFVRADPTIDTGISGQGDIRPATSAQFSQLGARSLLAAMSM